MSKRINASLLALVFALFMVMTSINIPRYAMSVNAEDTIIDVSTFNEFLETLEADWNEEYLGSGEHIIRFANDIIIGIQDGLIIDNLLFDIDLNGHELICLGDGLKISNSTLTIKRGTIRSSGHGISLDGANLTLDVADIVSTDDCLVVDDNSTAVINACEFISNKASAIENHGETVVNYGVYTAKTSEYGGYSFKNYNKITLNGGVFIVEQISSIGAIAYNEGTIILQDNFGLHDGNRYVKDYNEKGIIGSDGYFEIKEFKTLDASFAGGSISLKDDIKVKLYLTIGESVAKDNGAYILVSKPNGTEYKTFVKNAAKSGDYYLVVATMVAKEMTDDIGIKIVDSEGNETEEYTYSIQKYAKDILESDNAAYTSAKPLVKAMLNYGAKTQLYIPYNTDKLANDILDNEDKEVERVADLSDYEFTAPEATDNVAYTGMSLLLKDEVYLRVYFSSDDELTAEDYNVTVAGKKISSDRIVVGGSGDKQYVDIMGLKPTDYGKKLSVSVKDITVDGLSIYTYIYRAQSTNKQALKDLLDALYQYGKLAESYSGK